MKSMGQYLLSRNNLIGHITNYILSYYEAIKGPIYAQRHHAKSIKRGRSVRQALIELEQRWHNIKSPAKEKPIFILSAGWRSGSTLMQRLVMSKKDVLIWGEPYSHALIFQHLSSGISAITKEWPQDDWFIGQYELDKLETTFVANLYPEIEELQAACLAYMKTLLEETAIKRGFNRWGVKDVRLTIDDAMFLKWMYPYGKFIFLVRNPYNAYRSYRLTRDWYNEWPDSPIFTARSFGQHWRYLADGFAKGVSDVGGRFIRYEDLCAGEVDINDLEQYLELEINASLLEKKVGSHRRSNDTVPGYEKKMLRKEVAILAEQLGYENNCG